MPVTLEDEAEAAGVAGFAMTAGTAAETAISILGTDVMGRIETREAANAIGTGIAEIERVIGDAHDRLASTPRDLGEAPGTAVRLPLAHPTRIPHSVWLAAGFEEAETEDAGAGTEAEDAAASMMIAIASDLAAAPRKAVGVVIEMSETAATDGSTPTLAETLETTVTPANVDRERDRGMSSQAPSPNTKDVSPPPLAPSAPAFGTVPSRNVGAADGSPIIGGTGKLPPQLREPSTLNDPSPQDTAAAAAISQCLLPDQQR
ncbi:MYB-like DNA-binding domain-containing protein [Colletotrichum tofieldiae]|nr:MYB-like DNA-binding domain-containing protein [Colletotrichum tofieldiae]